MEDSNISAYGSKEHKDAKLNAAKSEVAWTGAGQQVGTEIWRIEKFQVVPWPKTKYGSFYAGDAYIVLNTYKVPDNDAFRYNVHFWLGGTSSQDEQGTAAYKTVELDDLLGDTPVQFREVQGSESEEFMGIFGGQIVTMEGGVASGFNNVKPKDYKPRLLQMKGKKLVHVSEVPLAHTSLNNGDVFLLDNGLTLYQWNGVQSGMFERRKAVEIIAAIKEDRNGRPQLTVLDGLESNTEFWTLLGTGGAAPSSVAEPTPDVDEEKVYPKRLFKLSDSSGHLEMTLVGEGKEKILQSKLDMTDVFLLDVGSRIDVWIGKKASKQERANGITFGVSYLQQQGRPASTPVQRITQGREPESFKNEFPQWK
jgi:gelsolin